MEVVYIPRILHNEMVLVWFRYGKREAMAYAASKVQGCYGTVLRVLSEVLNTQ